MSQLLTFRRFPGAQEAADVLTLLHNHNIPAVYEEEITVLDKNFIGQNFDQPFLIKMPPEYFTTAANIIRNTVKIDTTEVEPDYYLLSFTNEELIEVVIQKDEWGAYDYALALKLLEERGITYTPDQLENFNQLRRKELSRPEKGVPLWIFIGYASVIMGGLLGMFIGGFLYATKKTLPDGTRIFAYTQATRNQGRNIILTGIVSFLFWLFMALNGTNGHGLSGMIQHMIHADILDRIALSI